MFTTRIPWYCNGKEGKVPCLRKGASVCGKTIMMDEATRRYRCRRNTSIAAQELPDVGVRVRVRAQLCVFAEGRVRGRGTAAAVRVHTCTCNTANTYERFRSGHPPHHLSPYRPRSPPASSHGALARSQTFQAAARVCSIRVPSTNWYMYGNAMHTLLEGDGSTFIACVVVARITIEQTMVWDEGERRER